MSKRRALRALLADELQIHLRLSGVAKDDAPDMANHLVHVLFSFPGVAIVELPDGRKRDHGITAYGDALVAEQHPGQVGRPGSLHWLSPADARKQAADLLAAAAAVQKATNDRH